MKRILLLLFLLCSAIASAQRNASNYGSSLDITAGYAQGGYAVNGGFNYYLNSATYVQGAVYLSFATNEQDGFEIPYKNFTLNIGYFKNVYFTSYKKNKLAVGAGFLIGNEVINEGNEELEGGILLDNTSELLYGLFIGAEVDIYFSEKISIIGKVNQYYHPSSDLGNLIFYGGAGIRYILF